MINIKKTLAIVACCFTLNACTNNAQDEVMPANSLTTSEVVVKNGALHFKDMDVFVKITNQLNDGTLDANLWVKSIEFNNSLKQVQAEKLAKGEVLDTEDLEIPDPVFASILNANGVYFIGDEAHKVTDEYEYVANAKEVDKLSNINANSTLKTVAGVKAHKVKIGLMEKQQNARLLGKVTREKFPYINRPVPYDNRDDLKAQLIAWSRTYAVYSSVGIRITGRKYSKDGLFGSLKWRDDKMDFASISWSAVTQVCHSGGCSEKGLLTGFESDTNEKSISKTINYAAGIGMWHVTDYVEGEFKYRDEGWQEVTWNERFDD